MCFYLLAFCCNQNYFEYNKPFESNCWTEIKINTCLIPLLLHNESLSYKWDDKKPLILYAFTVTVFDRCPYLERLTKMCFHFLRE